MRSPHFLRFLERVNSGARFISSLWVLVGSLSGREKKKNTELYADDEAEMLIALPGLAAAVR